MPLFHRDPPAAAPPEPAEDGDSPAAMRAALQELERTVNRAAGRLPNAATVGARRVTDVLGEILDTAAVRPLDIQVVISVRQTIDDYLSTTIQSYRALDPSVVGTARPSGRTPTDSLLEQLDALESSVRTVLTAARAQDVDTLLSQGSFLATKFSRSDLDL